MRNIIDTPQGDPLKNNVLLKKIEEHLLKYCSPYNRIEISKYLQQFSNSKVREGIAFLLLNIPIIDRAHITKYFKNILSKHVNDSYFIPLGEVYKSGGLMGYLLYDLRIKCTSLEYLEKLEISNRKIILIDDYYMTGFNSVKILKSYYDVDKISNKKGILNQNYSELLSINKVYIAGLYISEIAQRKISNMLPEIKFIHPDLQITNWVEILQKYKKSISKETIEEMKRIGEEIFKNHFSDDINTEYFNLGYGNTNLMSCSFMGVPSFNPVIFWAINEIINNNKWLPILPAREKIGTVKLVL